MLSIGQKKKKEKKKNRVRVSSAMCLDEVMYKLIPCTTFEQVYHMLALNTRTLVLFNHV